MRLEKDPLRTIAVVLVGLVPAILQFYRTGDLSALIITGFSFTLLTIYFIYDLTRTEFMELQRRIATLESTTKGSIDPRNMIFVLLVILLILYLRIAGFI